jgi:hypothetical protein
VENSFNVGIGIASGMFCIAWLADVPPIASGETPAYLVLCMQKPSCAIDNFVAYKYTFRAEKSNNSVTSWLDDAPPEVHLNCAIRDRKNWSCHDGLSMVDGTYSSGNWVSSAERVGAIRFWGIRAGQWINGLLK